MMAVAGLDDVLLHPGDQYRVTLYWSPGRAAYVAELRGSNSDEIIDAKAGQTVEAAIADLNLPGRPA